MSDGTVLAEGETNIFLGKTDTSEAKTVPIRWTSVIVKEGDQMKLKLLTAFPKPTPPKEVSAK